MEVYDPLSQAQKHVMLRNGLFEFELDNFKQSSYCCCNHNVLEHLGGFDICLSKEPCICDRFLAKGTRVTTEKSKKEEQKQKEQIDLEDKLNSYLQQLTRM